MNRLQRMFGGGAAANPDAPLTDTSEQIYISSLALLKMLKHGNAPSAKHTRTRRARLADTGGHMRAC